MGMHCQPVNSDYALIVERLADRLGIAIRVCHYPPCTTKGNKVEHRLFSFIGKNWRGRPLRSYEAVVKITDDEMRTLRLRPHKSGRLELHTRTSRRIARAQL